MQFQFEVVAALVFVATVGATAVAYVIRHEIKILHIEKGLEAKEKILEAREKAIWDVFNQINEKLTQIRISIGKFETKLEQISK